MGGQVALKKNVGSGRCVLNSVRDAVSVVVVVLLLLLLLLTVVLFRLSCRHFPGVVVVSSSYYYSFSSFCLFFLLFFLLLLSVLFLSLSSCLFAVVPLVWFFCLLSGSQTNRLGIAS